MNIITVYLCFFVRYYVCTFKMAEHAVTIRQLKPLKRHKLPWGTRRLAVEGTCACIKCGPYFTVSNSSILEY